MSATPRCRQEAGATCAREVSPLRAREHARAVRLREVRLGILPGVDPQGEHSSSRTQRNHVGFESSAADDHGAEIDPAGETRPVADGDPQGFGLVCPSAEEPER